MIPRVLVPVGQHQRQRVGAWSGTTSYLLVLVVQEMSRPPICSVYNACRIPLSSISQSQQVHHVETS